MLFLLSYKRITFPLCTVDRRGVSLADAHPHHGGDIHPRRAHHAVRRALRAHHYGYRRQRDGASALPTVVHYAGSGDDWLSGLVHEYIGAAGAVRGAADERGAATAGAALLDDLLLRSRGLAVSGGLSRDDHDWPAHWAEGGSSFVGLGL